MSAIDAVLLVSFGGPEQPDDVMPFLRRVVRGRNIPDERLKEVAAHYYEFGGRSPINDQNRRLIRTLEATFEAHGPSLPVYWGNRNWHPLLEETVQQMSDDGIRHALAFVTSPYSSYSSCRQYLTNIADAQAALAKPAPRIQKLRPYYNHPAFIAAIVERTQGALLTLQRQAGSQSVHVMFTAHSIPMTMATTSAYLEQLREVAALVSDALELSHWELVFQSRSGPPHQPWLEPDIQDALVQAKSKGQTHVLVVPIGFVSDHMEVIYDLDTLALPAARALGLVVERAPTVGDHPLFIEMIRELILEQMDGNPPRALGRFEPSPDICPADCCPNP